MNRPRRQSVSKSAPAADYMCVGVLGLEPRASALSVPPFGRGFWRPLTCSNLIKLSTNFQAQALVRLALLDQKFVRPRPLCTAEAELWLGRLLTPDKTLTKS